MGKRFLHIRNGNGFSLIEMLVVLVIGAIAMLGTMQVGDLQTRVNARTSFYADRNSVKQMLLSDVSCAATKTLNNCPLSGSGTLTLVSLVRQLPGGATQEVVRKTDPPSRYGDWVVRAECSPTNSGILVRAVRQPADATFSSTEFLADPLTKRVRDWADPGSLLLPVEMCNDASVQPSGAVLAEGDLPEGTWTNFTLSQPAIVMSNAVASFAYAGGGGGSTILDVQRNPNPPPDNTTWIGFPGAPVLHCGSDSVFSDSGNTVAVQATATCQKLLAPGRYRIRAWRTLFGGTTVNYFTAHFFAVAR